QPTSYYSHHNRHLHSFPTRRSSDLPDAGPMFPAYSRLETWRPTCIHSSAAFASSTTTTRRSRGRPPPGRCSVRRTTTATSIHSRSEEHTSELQSLAYLVCRLLLEKK